MGAHGYVVPRGDRALAGSTMEHVGFDASPTAEGAGEIRRMVEGLVPSFSTRAVAAHWAGLRPVTPDLLPIVGRNTRCEALLYACGHSKNGVLLAPLTGQVIADLLAHRAPTFDLAAYSPGRFDGLDR